MKDFLDKGMAKCPYKLKKFWDAKTKKKVDISIVCPESAWDNELICLRSNKLVSDMDRCPRISKKPKPKQPQQLDWIGQ